MFTTDEYQKVLNFHVHLGMTEMAQRLGDAVSAGMFQMVTMPTVRQQTAWQVVACYQEVSISVLVSWYTEMC